MIQDFKESCEITINQNEKIEEKKQRNPDLEDQEPLVRGEGGEYNNTRGRSGGQLKMKQKDLMS